MSENKGTKMKISVKDMKRGRMYQVPDPIDLDDLSEDERNMMNLIATDPHFYGPGYGED
jgi:hypothetical protein